MKSSSNSVLPVFFAVGSASIVAAAAAFAAKRANYRYAVQKIEEDEMKATDTTEEDNENETTCTIEKVLPDASKEEDVVVDMPTLMNSSSFSVDEDDSSESGSDSSTHASDHSMILKKDLLVKSPAQPEYQFPLSRGVLLVLIASLLCAVMTQNAVSTSSSNRPVSLGLGSLQLPSIKKNEEQTAQNAKDTKTIRQVILCDFH